MRQQVASAGPLAVIGMVGVPWRGTGWYLLSELLQGLFTALPDGSVSSFQSSLCIWFGNFHPVLHEIMPHPSSTLLSGPLTSKNMKCKLLFMVGKHPVSGRDTWSSPPPPHIHYPPCPLTALEHKAFLENAQPLLSIGHAMPLTYSLFFTVHPSGRGSNATPTSDPQLQWSSLLSMLQHRCSICAMFD